MHRRQGLIITRRVLRQNTGRAAVEPPKPVAVGFCHVHLEGVFVDTARAEDSVQARIVADVRVRF